jgi:hypothetical protein
MRLYSLSGLRGDDAKQVQYIKYNIDISKFLCFYIILIITALLVAVDTVVAPG